MGDVVRARTLVRSQTVLDVYAATAERAHFSSGDDAASIPCVSLPADVWTDMGLPNRITVTVEPGDRLNDGRS